MKKYIIYNNDDLLLNMEIQNNTIFNNDNIEMEDITMEIQNNTIVLKFNKDITITTSITNNVVKNQFKYKIDDSGIYKSISKIEISDDKKTDININIGHQGYYNIHINCIY